MLGHSFITNLDRQKKVKQRRNTQSFIFHEKDSWDKRISRPTIWSLYCTTIFSKPRMFNKDKLLRWDHFVTFLFPWYWYSVYYRTTFKTHSSLPTLSLYQIHSSLPCYFLLNMATKQHTSILALYNHFLCGLLALIFKACLNLDGNKYLNLKLLNQACYL